MSGSHIAILWSRFGPYHLARLRGAVEALRGKRVTGIEIASDDRDYDWAIAPGTQGFDRRTIFQDLNYHDLRPSRVRSAVKKTLASLAPDVVAINGWSVPEARAALGWARGHGATAILMTETKADDAKRVWWKEAAKKLVVRRFDAALVGGQLQAEYLSALGFPNDRIRAGYDAVDNPYFEKRSDDARRESVTLRHRLRLPETYFFACTRFLKRKNLDGLLRAYSLYRKRTNAPWSLVIAGSGAEEASLRHLAQELGVSGSICWAGFVQYPELPIYFGLASAFIHPAKAEAWGLVVNEASASALPLLVAQGVGAAAELVLDGQTGFVFDADDDDDMARAMCAITSLPDEARKQIGLSARAHSANWGPARFGTELANLISYVSESRSTVATLARRSEPAQP